MLASLARAADIAPTTPGTLAAGSAGGYLLMGIFIHLVIVFAVDADARPARTRPSLPASCFAWPPARMTALYWFAGVGAPRACGWPRAGHDFAAAAADLGNVATSAGAQAGTASTAATEIKAAQRSHAAGAAIAFSARYSGVRQSWAHRGGLGMVAGFWRLCLLAPRRSILCCW